MSSSYPFFQQQSEMDCGAACLRMVTRYYGRYFSQGHLKELTAFGQEGVSLLDISEAAEKIGLRTLAARLSFAQIRDDVPMPAIVHWKGYHFVVVFEVRKNTVIIGDPAVGILELSHEDFISSWTDNADADAPTGVALVLEPTPEFLEKEDDTIDRTSLTFIWQNLRKHRRLLVQLLLGLFFGSILQLAMPFIIMAIVDVGISNEDMNFVWLILGALLVLFISQTSVEFIRGWIIRYIGTHFNINLLTDFLIKMMRLPVKFFETHTIGDLMQRIADNDRLERFLASAGLFSFLSILNIVLFSLVLLAFDWKIFLVFLLGTVAYLAWMRLFTKKRRELDFKRFEQSAISHNYMLDIIRGMQDIKLNNAERQRRWAWEKIQSKVFKIHQKALRTELWQGRGAFFLNEVKNIAIIALAAQGVIHGHLSLGMLFAILYILGQLNAPINHIVEFIQELQGAAITLERMSEIHDMDAADDARDKINAFPDATQIRIEDLYFKYGGAGNPMVLKKINLKIPMGKTTAIVGTSGGGKTTLLKCLLGIYHPTEGSIRIGNINLNHLKDGLWRKRTAAVLQDSYLFSDTIARNIALADEIIDTNKLMEVLRLTNLQTFVDKLPQNFNTMIQDESSLLSQGTRQKILIARALYKDPEFLFLDEATNGLDAYSEMMVLENIKDHLAGKTLVLVAHRISTITFADQIIMIEDGEVIETGTHRSLIDREGAYYHLVKRQLELGS